MPHKKAHPDGGAGCAGGPVAECVYCQAGPLTTGYRYPLSLPIVLRFNPTPSSRHRQIAPRPPRHSCIRLESSYHSTDWPDMSGSSESCTRSSPHISSGSSLGQQYGQRSCRWLVEAYWRRQTSRVVVCSTWAVYLMSAPAEVAHSGFLCASATSNQKPTSSSRPPLYKPCRHNLQIGNFLRFMRFIRYCSYGP